MPDSRRLAALGGTTLLVAAVALLVAAAFHAPLEGDEAYNLQIVHQLLSGHGYSTAGAVHGHPTQFDALITTGPTLMLPVAALASILGEHLWVYRIVPTLAYVCVVALWARLGSHAAGQAGALAAAVGVVALDVSAATGGSSTIFGPGDVLGEFLALAFVLAAAAQISRAPLSGLLLGLAVMTKLIAVLTLPGLLLVVLVAARRRGRSWPGAAGLFAVMFTVPVLAWQVVRVVAVGPAAAGLADHAYVQLFLSGGSGVRAVHPSSPMARLALQRPLVGWVGVVLLVVLVATAVLVLVRVLGAGGMGPHRFATGDAWLPIAGLAVASVTVELWWLFVSDRDWVRHSVIGVYVGVPAAFVLGAHAVTRLRRRQAQLAFGGLASILSVVVVTGHVLAAWHPAGPTLAQQRAVAARVAATAPSFHFVSTDFSPQLTLLSGVPASPLGSAGGLLVEPRRDGAPNAEIDSEIRLCDTMAWEEYGYVACWVDPEPRRAPVTP